MFAHMHVVASQVNHGRGVTNAGTSAKRLDDRDLSKVFKLFVDLQRHHDLIVVFADKAILETLPNSLYSSITQATPVPTHYGL